MANQVLTIEYLDDDGHLQRREQLSGTAFTLRVQTGGLQVHHGGPGGANHGSDASARAHSDEPLRQGIGDRLAIKRAPVWGWVLLLGVVFSLIIAWEYWIDHNPDQANKNYAENALVIAAALAVWASFWSMLGKVFAKRADFGLHLCVVMGMGILIDQLLRVLHFLAYSMSWYVLGRMDSLVLIGSGCLLVWAHQRLIVSPARMAINSAVMLAVGAVVIGMAMWSNYRKSDTVLNAFHSPYLYQPGFQLRPYRVADDFFEQAAGLEAVLKAKAAELEPGEDVAGSDSNE